MFTGIIEEIGKVKKIQKRHGVAHFEITASKILKNKIPGQSISVNGVCTTITELSKDHFFFDAISETLRLTNLSSLKKNSPVNLESSLKFGDDLDGHFVLGHVDCSAKVLKTSLKDKRKFLNVEIPSKIKKFISLKGSITINGVSLTISEVNTKDFSVDLIPETLKKTNLKNLKKNDKVNLEIDMVARYLNTIINGEK